MIEQTIRNEPLIQHIVNLDLPHPERWKSIIAAERDCARELFDGVMVEFKDMPRLAIDAFGVMYRSFKGPFQSELQQWADALNISFGEAALVNCAYEFSHIGGGFTAWFGKLNPFGCTTALCNSGGAMVHARNLDWPIPSMAAATRLFRYQKGKHEFVSVGFPMFVGVLSGMVPGEYSVTINWAPPEGVPNFQHGPAFLLRRTLEECATYEAAAKRLKKTELSTSVFYTLCGKSPGQACVIERTKDTAVIREAGSGCEAQSNHHIAGELEKNNEVLKTSTTLRNDPLLGTTKQRRETMLQKLGAIPSAAGDLTQLFALLSDEPITNAGTVQRMIFCPARGELHIDRCLAATKTKMEWGRFSWRATLA